MLRTLLNGQYVQIVNFLTRKFQKQAIKLPANVDINIASYVDKIGVKLIKFVANRLTVLLMTIFFAGNFSLI